MRFTLSMLPDDPPLTLPIHYNELVQGLIYQLLDEPVRHQLHEKGFKARNRVYRMFVFSRLQGDHEFDSLHGVIRFTGPVSLTVSSPWPDFCGSLAQVILQQERILLGRQSLRLEGLRVSNPQVQRAPILFRALSPVTVYSTVRRQDGTRFTYYFEPQSAEFERLVAQNLVRKCEAITGTPYTGPGVKIRWLRGRPQPVVARYKSGVIKGYMGTFHADGEVALLQIALDAGLGAKNAQGFGMVELQLPQSGEGAGQGADREPDPARTGAG